ncbi:hypothetical protein QZH41_012300 [Actinostola sp. cb2023]|nr:hypothetical protein QZH41_012300 [Actinostola sp. cb2023]
MAANASTSASSSSSTSKPNSTDKDKETLRAVLRFLKNKNLTETEKIFRQEANCLGSDRELNLETSLDIDTDISSVLSAYNSEADPSRYEEYYTILQHFVEKSLDIYKPELAMVLYPLFIHMYLELVYKGFQRNAQSFFSKFRNSQEDYHEGDIVRLSLITKREDMDKSEFMAILRSNKFVIRMSRDTYQVLKKHLQDTQLETLLIVIQQHLHFDVFDGRPRNKQSIDATSGGITGEATFEANKTKVLYGLQPEPDLGITIEDDNEEEEDKDKPKKKKAKKENGPGRKKFEFNPNAPPLNRIPFPELKDSDKMHKAQVLKEKAKRLKLDADTVPSICFYSVLNSHEGVNCASISDDATLLSAGFEDSIVRVWGLTPKKLRSLKTPSELNKIDKEAEDVMERIMDDKYNGSSSLTCISRSGRYLVSSGVDQRILVWDLAEGTLITQLKGHKDTVYSLCFCRDGNILASGGVDNCVKLWNAKAICNPEEEEDDSHAGMDKSADYQLGSYSTKNTPIHFLHFTYRNLLLATGQFNPT